MNYFNLLLYAKYNLLNRTTKTKFILEMSKPVRKMDLSGLTLF